MNLKNHFLVATPKIQNDLIFGDSVIYVCEHNPQGAMGLMINRATDISVAELCCRLNGMVANSNWYVDDTVCAGGPMHPEMGFILHTKTEKPFDHSVQISDNLVLTTSVDVLKAIGHENMPEKYLVALGCCMWQGNQLFDEIKQDDWLVVEADERVLFSSLLDIKRLEAMELLGVTMDSLTGLSAGHC